jgi:hypothetical protein
MPGEGMQMRLAGRFSKQAENKWGRADYARQKLLNSAALNPSTHEHAADKCSRSQCQHDHRAWLRDRMMPPSVAITAIA